MWQVLNTETLTKWKIVNKVMQLNIDKTMLQGELREQEPMSKHTSWKTGGNADYYYVPSDIEDLSNFLGMLPPTCPVTWVGFGSNLLVRDGGIKGVVISVSGILNRLELIDENTILVDAGVSCAKLARFAARHGLSGSEFLAGIPGTIGGALAMNAGAYGGEIWNSVTAVETISRTGDISKKQKNDFDISYRSVRTGDDEWFLSSTIQLKVSSKEVVENSIREMLSVRAEAQPLGQHSSGSVFKNPDKDHAARLIDVSGLKGKQIGGAEVSTKHANFIINNGNASSSDIEQLIEYIQETVLEKHQVKLQPEVRIIGESENHYGEIKQ